MSRLLQSLTKAFTRNSAAKLKMESPDDNGTYNNEDPNDYSDQELDDQGESSSQDQIEPMESPRQRFVNIPAIPEKSAKAMPKISDMVNGAILQLKERKGSTVETILAFVVKKYRLEPEKTRKNIRGYLTRAIAKGSILHTGGEGVTSTFKLSPSTKAELLKVNRSAPARKKGRTANTTIGMSKRQKDISAMTAALKRKASMAAMNTPMNKKPASFTNADKRITTQMNGDIYEEEESFDIPQKNGKSQSAVIRPKRNLAKRGASTTNIGVKKSSKSPKAVY